MKRSISLFLIAMLLFSACAWAEGGLYPLTNAANKLAFLTENVTLKAEARFSYDGAWFKTFHGEYRQDSLNSYMSVMLDTPCADGSVYTGGYTVIGNGGSSYSNDTYNGNYYTTNSCEPSRTVLKSTSSLRKLGDLVLSAASLLNDATADAVALRDHTVTVNWSNPPQLVNSVLTLMAAQLIESQELDWGHYTSIYYDDYEAYLAHTYETIYGSQMPEDIYIDPDLYSTLEPVYAAMYNETTQASVDLIGGILLVHNDGTTEWFESEEAYLLADGRYYIYYDSYFDTLSAYHAEKYGQPFTDETLDTIGFSNNPDLWEAYDELNNELSARYADIVPQNADTVALLIHADGSYDELSVLPSPSYLTTTRRIAMNFSALKIDHVDAVGTLDDDGNLLSAEGVASFTIIDYHDNEHLLSVEFSCSASDYGTTHVGEFRPEDYGFVTYEQYVSEISTACDEDGYVFDYEAMIDSLTGKSLALAGQTYPIIVDHSDYCDSIDG